MKGVAVDFDFSVVGNLVFGFVCGFEAAVVVSVPGIQTYRALLH